MRSWINPLLAHGRLEGAAGDAGRIVGGDDRHRSVAAAAFVAVGVLVAYLSAEGQGLAVVLVELIVVAVLVGAATQARRVTAAWIPALVTVCVVVVVPFMLPLPTLGVGPRTAVAGGVQLLAVAVLARHCAQIQPDKPELSVSSFLAGLRPAPVRPTPGLAWSAAVLAGIGLGLLAHVLVHFGLAARAPLPDIRRMGRRDQVTELVGVLLLGVVVEEGLFRHFLAPLSRAALGRWSILFDGALYATLYGASRSVWWCLVVVAAGTAAAWYRLRYGRFGPVVLAHVVANVFAFVILR